MTLRRNSSPWHETSRSRGAKSSSRSAATAAFLGITCAASATLVVLALRSENDTQWKQVAARFSQLWGRFSPKRRGEDLEESDDEQTYANELERIAVERALHSIGVKLLNLQALRSGIILDDLHPVHQPRGHLGPGPNATSPCVASPVGANGDGRGVVLGLVVTGSEGPRQDVPCSTTAGGSSTATTRNFLLVELPGDPEERHKELSLYESLERVAGRGRPAARHGMTRGSDAQGDHLLAHLAALAGFNCAYHGALRVARSLHPTAGTKGCSSRAVRDGGRRTAGSAEGEGVPGDATRNGVASAPRWFAAFGDFRANMLSPCTLTVRVGEGAPEGAQSLAGFRFGGITWRGLHRDASPGGMQGEMRMTMSHNDDWGRQLQPVAYGTVVVRFFHDGVRLQTGKVRSALDQLVALRQCYMIGTPREGYTCSGCHPASLVMAYDAEEALTGRGADPGASATESHHEVIGQETIHVRVVGLRACAVYGERRAFPAGGNAPSPARPGAPERCGNGILVVHGIGKVVQLLEELLELASSLPVLAPPELFTVKLARKASAVGGHVHESAAPVEPPVPSPCPEQERAVPGASSAPVDENEGDVRESRGGTALAPDDAVPVERPSIRDRPHQHACLPPPGRRARSLSPSHGRRRSHLSTRRPPMGDGWKEVPSLVVDPEPEPKLESESESESESGSETEPGPQPESGPESESELQPEPRRQSEPPLRGRHPQTVRGPRANEGRDEYSDDGENDAGSLVERDEHPDAVACGVPGPSREEYRLLAEITDMTKYLPGLVRRPLMDVPAEMNRDERGAEAGVGGNVLSSVQGGEGFDGTLMSVLRGWKGTVEALDRSARELQLYRDIRSEACCAISVALEATMNTFRGQVLVMTAKNAEWLASKARQCQQASDIALKLFKEAHLAVKSVIVTIGGEGPTGERWRMSEQQLRSLEKHQLSLLLHNMRLLVVAFDNMREEDRKRITTVNEIINNRDWLLRMATICTSAERRGHVDATEGPGLARSASSLPPSRPYSYVQGLSVVPPPVSPASNLYSVSDAWISGHTRSVAAGHGVVGSSANIQRGGRAKSLDQLGVTSSVGAGTSVVDGAKRTPVRRFSRSMQRAAPATPPSTLSSTATPPPLLMAEDSASTTASSCSRSSRMTPPPLHERYEQEDEEGEEEGRGNRARVHWRHGSAGPLSSLRAN